MATVIYNDATLNGRYAGEEFDPLSANTTVAIVEASLAKSADPSVWIGSGPLTYTVAITNDDADLPLTNLVLTDVLDQAITYLSGSAAIDGVPIDPANVTYDAGTGLLTIQLPDVAANTVANVTFQVEKRP